MKVDARVQAWVRLHAAGLPTRAWVALLTAFGSADAILAASPAARQRVVAAVAPFGFERADPARIEATLAWLEAPGHDLLAWDDSRYPAALLTVADPPPVLFALGDSALAQMPGLAIVGSRNATPQGCADAEAFARTLSNAGLVVVSGLALGIDAAAHRGGLAGVARSIAVIGTGPDRIYPARNADLAHALAREGLILSEFAPGTPPLRAHFPRRNRIISGLARGVLVVEATLSSGSLITARLAGEQGREVFAIPGSIHSPFARGCHKLIREGAKLVETAEDVLAELSLPALASPAPRLQAETPEASGDARKILSALGHHVLDVETLIARTALPVERVTAELAALEIDGEVSPLVGGKWQRRSASHR